MWGTLRGRSLSGVPGSSWDEAEPDPTPRTNANSQILILLKMLTTVTEHNSHQRATTFMIWAPENILTQQTSWMVLSLQTFLLQPRAQLADWWSTSSRLQARRTLQSEDYPPCFSELTQHTSHHQTGKLTAAQTSPANLSPVWTQQICFIIAKSWLVVLSHGWWCWDMVGAE